MEVSLELERTIAGNSKKPMMPQRRVFRDLESGGVKGGVKGTGKTTEPYDIVPYRPSNSLLENHHGVMDV